MPDLDVVLRRATPDDIPALEVFLARHCETSMFLRANLAAHGAEEATHPHGTRYWLQEGPNGVRGVVACTNSGYLMAQAPEADAAFWRAGAACLAGRRVIGMTGVPDQVAACLHALGLAAVPKALDAVEGLYALALETLAGIDVSLRTPRPADLPLLQRWFAEFAVDSGMSLSGDRKSDTGRARAAAAIDSTDIVICEAAGLSVAMAGVNARLPDTVQIGGVFTERDRRGQGHARRAVAGLLRECAAQGVTRAILFTHSPQAARAYQAVGFRRIGDYRVMLLDSPVRIGGPA